MALVDVFQLSCGASKAGKRTKPLRKIRIIGYIMDSQPGGLIPMVSRDIDLAAGGEEKGATDFCPRPN
jgi:hypothetical protein